MKKHRIAVILIAWYAVGILILGSILFAGNNVSAGAFSGTISNDQTLRYDITVTSTLMPITVYVYWMTIGDDIDMNLKNPSGVVVESADATADFAETLIHSPDTTGTYVLEVVGYDITSAASISFTGNCMYHQIALQTGGGTVPGSINWLLIIGIIVAIVVVVIIVLLLVVMRKKPTQPMAPPAYGVQQPAQQYAYQQPAQAQYQPAQYPPSQYQAPPPQPQQYPPVQQQVLLNCPYCGTKLDPNWSACPKCGARIR